MRSSLMAQVDEGIIPRLEEIVQMRFDDADDLVALVAAEALNENELQRIEPDFSGTVVTRNMDMRWLESKRGL